MHPFKTNLLATTVVPVALVAAAGMTAATVSGIVAPKPAMSACAPCNPCAAKNPCNPCAAKNPCNPCAATHCNPCGAAGGINCVVPRLAKACSPCNPCAAKNPCAASACSPCAANNTCNPCAAANPCNPCAAANPCNPCAAGAAAELTDAEAAAAYDCLRGGMRAAYGKSGNATAARYAGWPRYSRVAYQSATHGARYVQNYANPTARAYGGFEKAGVMPVGSILAKDSFTVSGKGRAVVGPLFLMEKMPAGFNAESGNWKYSMIMPNGSVFGETSGKNSAGMQFCIECHAAVADGQDHIMFLPEDYRRR